MPAILLAREEQFSSDNMPCYSRYTCPSSADNGDNDRGAGSDFSFGQICGMVGGIVGGILLVLWLSIMCIKHKKKKVLKKKRAEMEAKGIQDTGQIKGGRILGPATAEVLSRGVHSWPPYAVYQPSKTINQAHIRTLSDNSLVSSGSGSGSGSSSDSNQTSNNGITLRQEPTPPVPYTTQISMVDPANLESLAPPRFREGQLDEFANHGTLPAYTPKGTSDSDTNMHTVSASNVTSSITKCRIRPLLPHPLYSSLFDDLEESDSEFETDEYEEPLEEQDTALDEYADHGQLPMYEPPADADDVPTDGYINISDADPEYEEIEMQNLVKQ
ncbi:hypothetical protein WICPIJ_003472 [Wickerhamomyces pijperi]|uniref:Uncharacterized protein n=1 Tax=Wickerhamomyces pijperi TaxID=599730 RepID=A0A9P8TNN6_WICPI|nr:hypothetical protein WICPIJ_003472 [Wickerhamomyces pijperi]